MSRGYLQMLMARWRAVITAVVLSTAVLSVAHDASAEPVRPVGSRPLPTRSADPPARAPVRPSQVVQARPSADAPAGRVKVDVMVVYANNSGQVDPRLRGLKEQLAMMNFTGYQVLSTHTAALGTGQDQAFAIEGGRKMEITVVSFTETSVRVRIELFKGSEKTIDTTVNIRNGRTFLMGGPKYQGGSLIFPLTVSR
jgi:hypothetical protein